MPQVGLKPTIPVFERAKTVHASDLAATEIGSGGSTDPIIKKFPCYGISCSVSEIVVLFSYQARLKDQALVSPEKKIYSWLTDWLTD
jgi:hypothetical protein